MRLVSMKYLLLLLTMNNAWIEVTIDKKSNKIGFTNDSMESELRKGSSMEVKSKVEGAVLAAQARCQ